MQDATATPLDAAQQKRARLIAKLTNNAPVNSISRRESPGMAPLSFGQEALWLMSHLAPDNPIYNVAGALEFNGRLNIAALQQSLDEVVRRHEILHSRFGSEQGTVIQRVDGCCQLSLRLLDLDNVDAALADGCFQHCADEFIRMPFDLNNAAPLRAMLLKLVSQRHILVLALHHIVADRWSVGILMREVAGLYRQFGSGLPSTLPELGIDYGDFAAWQRQQGSLVQNHQDYWQQKLQGLPPLLALPTDYPRPASLSYRGDLYHFALPPGLSVAINQLAKQYNATLFMVMAAALQVLLHRYTGSDDIAIGYTVAGRTQSQVTELIGFFVNTLVLRGQLDDDNGFADLLAKTRSQALDDQAHQDIAFGQLLEAVNPVRNPSYAPLFQVMLTVQNAPRVDFRLPGLEVTPVRLDGKAAQFDLTFLFEEQEGVLQGTIEYSTDLFASATLGRLAGHLQTLLTAMVANPELALKQLPILTPAEWQQMVVDWNTSKSASDDVLSQPLTQRFAKQAQVTPDHMALVFVEEKLSYRELNQRANDLAHTLHDLGIKPESRVGVCAERSVDLVVALLAVLKAGAAYLPLDPSYPQERLDFMAKDAAVALLLVQTAFVDRFQKLLCPIVSIKQNATAREPLVCPASLDNTAYLIYTSGSSGQPKGVAVSHRNLLHSTLARFEYYQESPDCFLLLSSFAFDSSVAGIFWTLSQGGCLCLPQTADTTNPNALAKLIQKHQVSHVLALPSFYAALISEANLPLLATLKAVIVAGEACSGELANEHQRKLPQVKLFNEYGPTEATVWSSVYHSETSEATGTLTIGRAIDRVQMYILDKHSEPVPMGVSGELYIAGAGIAQGYINRPGLTAEKFIPNPFGVAGSRLYKTGDLAKFRDDGNIEFLGRMDYQVKIRGFRIELGEIEARLTCFPSVRAAVVLAREDNPGDKRLVAYLLADVELNISDLREHLSLVLPDYMIPGAFVRLAEFPLTPNGKLDRRALPEPDRMAVSTQDYAAPQTLAETVLAKLWQELLGVEKVGRDDHFFELGGHSLMAISLVEQLQQQGFSAEVMNVFTMPVLAEMAATLVADVPTTNRVAFGAIPEGSTVITPDMLPLVSLTQEAINALIAEVPGGIANIQDIYPLAPLQDGILFHHLLATDSDAYLKRSLLCFASRERLDSFLAALQIVIDRHDILRTAIHWQGLPHAVQVVQRQARLPIIHLSVEAGVDALQTLQEQTQLIHLRMGLQKAPLFVAYILFDPIADKWLLALVNHHLIDDNYTLQLILSEINQIFLGQGDQLLPPLPYRHFIAQVISVPETEHEAYFRSQLGDIDAPTAPFGVLDIQGNGSQINEAHLVLDESLAQRLYSTARQQGVTVAVLCHVAWAQVLAQCTGRDDVVFGTVLSGRLQTQTGASQALGVFINTLPIRLSLDGYSVRQIVADCYSRLGRLLDHEHAALALAQRCSGVAAGLPLFTTLLNYRHSNLIAENSTELFAWQDIELLATEERTNYPVTLCVDDLGEGIRITAQCVQDIDAVRIAAYFETALDKLTEALQQTPDFRVCQLSILPDSERQQLLQNGNAHLTAYPAQPCLHQRFEAHAASAPNAIALSYQGQTLSYGGLNRLANRLAHALIAHGVRPDQLVALCAERSPDMVIGLLAIHKAGGAYLPLDPGYPDERLAYLLADSRPVAMVTQTALQPRLAALSQGQALPTLILDVPVVDETHHQAPTGNPVGQGGTDSNPGPLGLTPDHLAYVIHTSGSTGQPKGVMVSHANAARLFAATEPLFRFNADDTWTLFHAIAFDFSVWELWGALAHGGRLVIVPQATARNPQAFYHLLCEERVTVLNQTPGAFRQLIAAQSQAQDQDQTPPTHQLRTVIFGGEALDFASLRPWLQASPLAQTRLVNMYGITETTVHATVRCLNEADIHHGTASNIGQPLADLSLYILDPYHQPVPVGVTGEIYLGGAGVARGYLDRPELTADRFIPNPFHPATEGREGAEAAKADAKTSPSRLYKTGDLGRWLPDGTIEYLGRNDFQVKLRGFRIELGEIEAQLRRCPGIREAAVLARTDHTADPLLVAYLVPDPGHAPDPADLRARLAAHLAEHMLPAAYVTLERFPLTANGKLDRKALPEPDGDAIASRVYEAPQGGTETVLATLWQDLLHVEHVGRHDHFFELGGHSLLAVQFVARLRQALGIELPLRTLFDHPVLAALAEAAAPAARSALPPVTPCDRSQPIPLSWAQQRLWFIARLDPAASQAYHIALGLRLQGELDRTALQAALDRLVARHEALRTTFLADGGEPRQHIAPAASGFQLATHDLATPAPADQAAAIARHTRAEADAPFDLENGPLIRGRLLRLGEREHLLLVTQHHIIADGWSLGRLTAEFAALYRAFSQGQPDPLPPLALQYPDYAVWQRHWLQGGVLDSQLHYWRSQLDGSPGLLEMPTDRPRPAQQSHRGGSVAFSLPAALSDSLRHYSHRHGATLFMTLLTAWAILLSRLGGQTDLVIGTPVANRPHADLEALIGLFVNTLPLRVRLDGDPSGAALLAQVKATTLDAYSHPDLPFGQLVEALNPPRRLSHNPVVQVLLSLDNTPRQDPDLPGLSLSVLDGGNPTSQFDLSLSFTDPGDTLSGHLHYASDLYDPATIARFIGHYQTLLHNLTEGDSRPVSQLGLLTDYERQQLLQGGNASPASYPAQPCLHQRFEAHAASAPNAIALSYQGQTLSYGGLNRLANRLAHGLIAHGIRPDQRVALCAERSPDMVIGLLAIHKAGGAYLPLDPGYPDERLAYLLADSRPVAMVTQTALQPRLAALSPTPLPTLILDAPVADPAHQRNGQPQDQAGNPAGQGNPDSNPDPGTLGLTPGHLAYVIHTSGSTGQPKGVMVSHANAARLFAATDPLFRFNAGDTWTLFHAIAFDFSVWELWGALAYGGRLVIVPQATARNPQAFYRLLCEERVTVLNQTPGAFRQLIAAQSQAQDPAATHSLRTVIFGGEALDFASLRPWLQANPLAQTQLVNMYGITETTVHATFRSLNEADIRHGTASNIGQPLGDLSLYLLDPHHQPVPVGVTGEIYLGGAGVARGYLDRPGLTAGRFIPNPFRQAGDGQAPRLYKTGDLGRWRPDGTVDYLGRNDFQVKLRGFRIELGEIEAQLRRCPGVREAAVLARDDSAGNPRLVAYLIPEPGHPLEPADLRARLAEHLAEHMLPAAYVTLERFPLTANGKLDRQALPEPDGGSTAKRVYQAPQGATETAIARIWQELLHIAQVGRHDQFFELGGHSLLVITFIERLQQQGYWVSVRTVFTHPVLADMAEFIDSGQESAMAITIPPNVIPDYFEQSTGNSNIEEFRI